MFTYTLDLFKILIERQPVGLDQEIIEAAKAEYKKLKADEDAEVEEIEEAMVDFGKEIWPYMQAEYEFMQKYGKDQKREFFMNEISGDLQEKWLKCEDEDCGMSNYMEADAFEEYFDGEEQQKVNVAMTEAEVKAREYIRNLAQKEKSDEYKQLVENFKDERSEILSKITELKEIKEKTDKYEDEIQQEIEYFQKGFAEIEERPAIKDIEEQVDFYWTKLKEEQKQN